MILRDCQKCASPFAADRNRRSCLQCSPSFAGVPRVPVPTRRNCCVCGKFLKHPARRLCSKRCSRARAIQIANDWRANNRERYLANRNANSLANRRPKFCRLCRLDISGSRESYCSEVCRTAYRVESTNERNMALLAADYLVNGVLPHVATPPTSDPHVLMKSGRRKGEAVLTREERAEALRQRVKRWRVRNPGKDKEMNRRMLALNPTAHKLRVIRGRPRVQALHIRRRAALEAVNSLYQGSPE